MKMITFILFFIMIFALVLFSILLNIVLGDEFGCQSIILSGINGTFNKSYINCMTEPILTQNITNITNTTETIQIFNYTFNDTDISKSFASYLSNLTRYFGDVTNMNITIGRLLNENEKLMNENNKFKSYTPTYEILYFQFNKSQSELNVTKTNLEREESNKILYFGGGLVIGIIGYNILEQRQRHPEEKLFPSGRTKGEDEPINIDNIEKDLQKRKEELSRK